LGFFVKAPTERHPFSEELIEREFSLRLIRSTRAFDILNAKPDCLFEFPGRNQLTRKDRFESAAQIANSLDKRSSSFLTLTSPSPSEF
jgi:hypothetical protein